MVPIKEIQDFQKCKWHEFSYSNYDLSFVDDNQMKLSNTYLIIFKHQGMAHGHYEIYLQGYNNKKFKKLILYITESLLVTFCLFPILSENVIEKS